MWPYKNAPGARPFGIYPSDPICGVLLMRDAPDHNSEDFVLLAGTKLREMLGQSVAPPT